MCGLKMSKDIFETYIGKTYIQFCVILKRYWQYPKMMCGIYQSSPLVHPHYITMNKTHKKYLAESSKHHIYYKTTIVTIIYYSYYTVKNTWLSHQVSIIYQGSGPLRWLLSASPGRQFRLRDVPGRLADHPWCRQCALALDALDALGWRALENGHGHLRLNWKLTNN